MSARSEFEKQMKAAQEKAQKKPQNSTEALINELDKVVTEAPAPAPIQVDIPPAPVIEREPEAKQPLPALGSVRERTVTAQLGRPKKYEGQQEVISMKVPKDIKDKARIAAASRHMSFVDYFMTIINEDFNRNYSTYVGGDR